MTFSNPLFNSNDYFTYSDDESLSDEDVLKDNVKIYSNPLFEFTEEYISSDVNPFFDEVLEDIENKEFYVSNLDEPTLLVIPLFDTNETRKAIIFLSYVTYPVDSPFLLSSGSEDTIFDTGISAFHFSSLELVNTTTQIRDTDAYSFKLDKKKCKVDTEVFCEILQIYLILLNQEFVALPQKKNCFYLSRNLVTLEDFMYQADNKEVSSACIEHMPYQRFTKVIISHFISKDKTISMRNKINLHTIRNDSLLVTLQFVSKTKDSQKYEALIPDEMINQDIKESKAYKTYYDFATGKVALKKARKFKKIASPSRKLSLVKETKPVKKDKRVKRPAKKSTTASTTGVVIRYTLGVFISKKKAPDKGDRGKGIELLSDASLLEAAQVHDESEDKKTGTDEGTSTKLRVPDVPSYEFDSDNESWGDSEDESDDINDDDNDDDNANDDDIVNKDDDGNDAHDSERTDSDDDDDENL
nr:hypothetical protein [Tanacetum cinerariifolium]